MAPPYLQDVTFDQTAPDLTDCPPPVGPVFHFQASKHIVYEDESQRIVVFTYESFWRPNRVSLRVGTRIESDVHLVQFWLKRPDKPAYELLVLSPADGYWRLKTLPPRQLDEVAYGSSFLIGPIVEDGRPVVNIAAISFEPFNKLFRLEFSSGGYAEVLLQDVAQGLAHVHVTLDCPVVGRPFAGFRSMYVADDNADVSVVTINGIHSHNVMEFRQASAIKLNLGRIVISRHNTSAPDLEFANFTR